MVTEVHGKKNRTLRRAKGAAPGREREIVVIDATQGKQRSLRSLEWLNFFLADVQTGRGPFLAAYLASSGWNPGRVGYAPTFGGLVAVAMQTPAGAVIDAVHRKRTLLAVSLGVLVAGAFLLMGRLSPITVYSAQFLIGGSGPFLAPTVAAITLGIVGAGGFDKQFGKNQGFNSAGNIFTALLVAYVSYKFGYRAIFVTAAILAIPAAVSLFLVDANQIDYARLVERSKHKARLGRSDGPLSSRTAFFFFF